MFRDVIWLQSVVTGRSFPYLESAAEGDLEVDWNWPLVGTGSLELVMAEILPEEVRRYEWMRPEQPGLQAFEDRINAQTGRDDLRVSWRFIAGEHWIRTDGEWTLKEPQTQLERGYRDVFAPQHHARLIRRETVDAFEADGGVLTWLPES